ncbi:MAG: alkaline phosphatase family protein [Pseudonocardia sp.]|nr:alkaline phosphatase family protein [Pseudonocardia sp.]
MAAPNGFVLPDYGRRSLPDVLPSLMAALGVPGMANALQIEPAGRVCLLLVDGLGAHQLAAHPGDAPFLTAMNADHGPLTVGFPSSTVTSLTSLGTGVPPGSHGMVGITFQLASGQLLDALKWTEHTGGKLVDLRERIPPERVQPTPTVFERAAAQGVDVRQVVPREFEDSGLTRAALRGARFHGVYALGDLAAEVIDAMRAPAPVFCYAYHAHLDGLGHAHGPGSWPWRLQLSMIDDLVARIAEHLQPDGLIVVTGDHGMVEVPATRRVDADTDEALRAGVRQLGGDARSRHVYAQPGASDDVAAAWRERLGDRAAVLTREEAIAEGWFGPSVADAVRPRIGDVVAALRGDNAVIRSHAEPNLSRMPGQHGSLTADEQLVPLLTLRN